MLEPMKRVAAAEVAEVDPSTAGVGEQDRVLGGSELVESFKRLGLQWHRPVAESAVRKCSSHVNDAEATVDVMLLESEELGRSV